MFPASSAAFRVYAGTIWGTGWVSVAVCVGVSESSGLGERRYGCVPWGPRHSPLSLLQGRVQPNHALLVPDRIPREQQEPRLTTPIPHPTDHGFRVSGELTHHDPLIERHLNQVRPIHHYSYSKVCSNRLQRVTMR